MARQSADTLLDQCVGDVKSGRKTLAQCLAEHPDERRDLEPLLRIATSIVLPPVAPDPARKARARRELLAALERERRRPGPGWWPLWALARPAPRLRLTAPAVAGLVAAVGMVTSAGAAFAAQEAQPGDTLYGLKTAIEQVQVATAPSDEAKALTHLEIAAKRLAEVEKALQGDNAEAARVAAEAHARAVAEADVHLAQAEQQGRPVDAIVARLGSNLERQQAALKKAADKAAGPAQEALGKAQERAKRGLERAGERAKRAAPAAAPAGGAGLGRPGAPTGKAGAPAPAVTATPTAASAESQIEPIGSQIEKLEHAMPSEGRGAAGLRAKLDAAREALARGQRRAAVNQLRAFGNELEALHRSGHLDDETYAKLRTAHEALVRATLSPMAAPPAATATPPAPGASSQRPSPSEREAERGRGRERGGPSAEPTPERGSAGQDRDREPGGGPTDRGRGGQGPPGRERPAGRP